MQLSPKTRDRRLACATEIRICLLRRRSRTRPQPANFKPRADSARQNFKYCGLLLLFSIPPQLFAGIGQVNPSTARAVKIVLRIVQATCAEQSSQSRRELVLRTPRAFAEKLPWGWCAEELAEKLQRELAQTCAGNLQRELTQIHLRRIGARILYNKSCAEK